MTDLSGHATPHFVLARVRPGITIMRALIGFAALLLTGSVALADPPKLAVFDFELIDTSLPGEFYGSKPEEARLDLISEQLRKALVESGRFQLLDIADRKGTRLNSSHD